jgi:hypothetical protein
MAAANDTRGDVEMNLSPTTEETPEDADKKHTSRCAAIGSVILCGSIAGIGKFVKNYSSPPPPPPPTTTTMTLPGDSTASLLPGVGFDAGLEFLPNPESETSLPAPCGGGALGDYSQEHGGFEHLPSPEYETSLPEPPPVPTRPDTSHLLGSPSSYFEEMSLPTTLSYDLEASMPQHYL